MNTFRSRRFCVLLYVDNEKHKQVIENIMNMYDYAIILHDKDYNENGEIKKPHYHAIIQTKNAVWNTALSLKIGIELNLIQNCRNLELALNYLIHFNDDSKYQYDINEVSGSLKSKLEKQIINDGVSEDDKVLMFIEYLNNTNDFSLKSMVKFACDNGYYDVFRRSGIIFIKLLEEYRQTHYNDSQRTVHK